MARTLRTSCFQKVLLGTLKTLPTKTRPWTASGTGDYRRRQKPRVEDSGRRLTQCRRRFVVSVDVPGGVADSCESERLSQRSCSPGDSLVHSHQPVRHTSAMKLGLTTSAAAAAVGQQCNQVESRSSPATSDRVRLSRSPLSARLAALERQVELGVRDASTLVAIPADQARTASVSFPENAFGEPKPW